MKMLFKRKCTSCLDWFSQNVVLQDITNLQPKESESKKKKEIRFIILGKGGLNNRIFSKTKQQIHKFYTSQWLPFLP